MNEDQYYNDLSQKYLASIKRDTRVSLEDAVVRATHKVMAEFERETLAYRPDGLAQPSKNAGEDQVPTKGEKL